MKLTKQEKLVINSLLLCINLPVMRAHNICLKIPGLGTISTHALRKRSKAKYQTKYNKKNWKKQKKINDFSEKKLLF